MTTETQPASPPETPFVDVAPIDSAGAPTGGNYRLRRAATYITFSAIAICAAAAWFYFIPSQPAVPMIPVAHAEAEIERHAKEAAGQLDAQKARHRRDLQAIRAAVDAAKQAEEPMVLDEIRAQVEAAIAGLDAPPTAPAPMQVSPSAAPPAQE